MKWWSSYYNEIQWHNSNSNTEHGNHIDVPHCVHILHRELQASELQGILSLSNAWMKCWGKLHPSGTGHTLKVFFLIIAFLPQMNWRSLSLTTVHHPETQSIQESDNQSTNYFNPCIHSQTNLGSAIPLDPSVMLVITLKAHWLTALSVLFPRISLLWGRQQWYAFIIIYEYTVANKTNGFSPIKVLTQHLSCPSVCLKCWHHVNPMQTKCTDCYCCEPVDRYANAAKQSRTYFIFQ